MVRPTANARQPRFKSLELLAAEIGSERLQEEHGKVFLLQDIALKQIVGNFDQELEPLFAQNGAPKSHRDLAQLRRIPTPRLDFFLEKTLDSLGMGRRPAVLQGAANVVSDVAGCKVA